MIIVSLFSGIQLLSLGIMGEYVGRIYDEVKQRPKFILDSAHGIEAHAPHEAAVEVAQRYGIDAAANAAAAPEDAQRVATTAYSPTRVRSTSQSPSP